MEYKSTNAGLLQMSMVKEGDKLLIISDAYSKFVPEKQKTYWNAKVQLPDGTHKLAGLMESSCDAFAGKWGSNTEDWTGHTVMVQYKTSNSGKEYFTLVPTDYAKVDVSKIIAESAEDHDGVDAPAQTEKVIQYPTPESEGIDPNKIDF